MLRSRYTGFARINLLKKIKVGGKWRFCPAVVEPGRRLSDKVRVKGTSQHIYKLASSGKMPETFQMPDEDSAG